jgi:hypothetical protein
MQSKDLRIYNLVNQYGETQIIIPSDLEKMLKNEPLKVEEDEYSPILLTQKWIRKLGFKLVSDDGDVVYYEIGRFGLKIDECLDFYFYTKIGKDGVVLLTQIDFVHQLQNLYFALTGEELVLKNKSKP